MVRTISDIFEATISVSNAAFTGASFGESIIIEETTAAITDRVAEYESVDDLLDAGYTTSDQVYKMALAYFGQAIRPEKLFVGKKTKTFYNNWTIDFADDVLTGTFTLTITYNTTALTTAAIAFDATNDEIREAIDTIFSADLTCMVSGYDPTDSTAIITIDFTDRDVTTVACTPTLTGSGGAITAVATDNQAYSLGETWATAIAACRQEDDTAYEFEIANEDFFAIASVAAYIETVNKQFGALSKDSDCYDSSVTGDILSYLQAKNYKNTFTYVTKTADNFHQSAIAGKCLPKDPGSVNWNLQILSAVTADAKLTATEDTALTAKRGNYVVSLGGQTISVGGAVSSSGQFRDVVLGAHYLIAKIEEGIFQLLVEADKISYDDDGINQIVGKLREILTNEGVDNDIIIANSIVIDVPTRASIPAATRATRVLPDIEWSADLKGAINEGSIVGVLTA